MNVVYNDRGMRQRYSHLSSQKIGNLAILSSVAFQVYDQFSRQPQTQGIADIKVVSWNNSQGTPAKSQN